MTTIPIDAVIKSALAYQLEMKDSIKLHLNIVSENISEEAESHFFHVEHFVTTVFNLLEGATKADILKGSRQLNYVE